MGDGNGEAARFLDPKPRDFQTCQVKFAAVPAGSPPRDADYEDIITNGLKGTAMPAFPFIPQREKSALIAYLRSFCEKNQAPAAPVMIAADPWRSNPTGGIAEGERLYHGFARCWSCHPAYVEYGTMAGHMKSFEMPPAWRPNIYEPETKDSSWGAPLEAPDFLTARIKTGTELADVVQVIGAGVGGTAMPTWAGALDDKQLWGLAYYVRSVARLRGSAEGRALKKKLESQPAWVPPPEPEAETAADSAPGSDRETEDTLRARARTEEESPPHE
jgi:cytochrome c oxidase cbb3-type subunit 2